MANWMDGSLRIKGKPENIITFLFQGLEGPPTDDTLKSWKKDGVSVEINDILQSPYSDAVEQEYTVNIRNNMHVLGTYRGIIGEGYSTWQGRPDEQMIIALRYKQAWVYEESEWVAIAKAYKINIRLYGIECGMLMEQKIEIDTEGNLVANELKEYTSDDAFQWEVPFPWMGG